MLDCINNLLVNLFLKSLVFVRNGAESLMAFINLNLKSVSKFINSLTFFLLLQLIISFIFVIFIYLLYPEGVDKLSDEIAIIGSIGVIFLVIRGGYSVFAGWKWRSENQRPFLLQDWLEPLTIFGGVLFLCIFTIWILIPSIDEVLFWPTSGVLLVGIDVFCVAYLLLSLTEPMGEAVFMLVILFMLVSMVTIPFFHFLCFFIGYTTKKLFSDRYVQGDRAETFPRAVMTEKEVRYITILLGYFGVLFAFLFRDSDRMTVLGTEIELQPPLIMILMDVTGITALITLYVILRNTIKKK